MNRPTLLCALFLILAGWGVGASAQSIGIAPGIAYRMEDKLGGAHFRAYYHFPKWLSLGGEFNYFLPEQYEGDPYGTNNFYLSKKVVWSLNLNAHVDLRVGRYFDFYPLLGLNLTWLDDTGGGTFPDGSTILEQKDNNFGFNLGAGLHLFPEQMGPFFEYKYILGNMEQRVLTGGFVWIINLGAKDEDFVDDLEDPRLR